MKIKWIDTNVTGIQTAEGYLSLRKLFVPFFIEQLLMNMMGTVNTLVLGHYSDEAVAAVGAANQVMGLVYTFYAVISGGASIVISHKLGANKEQEAQKTAFSAFVVGVVLSIICSWVLSLFSMPIVKMLRLDEDILYMAEEYFRICVRFSFLQGIISVVSAVLRSYGKPKTAVFVSLFMNVINATLNVLIVYRPFDIPLEGTRGVAIANIWSHILAVVIIIICFVKSGIPHYLWFRSFCIFANVRDILRVGLPGGISSLSYSLSQVVTTSILGVLGTIAISTKIYISTVVFYVSIIGYSLGISTAILIGWMTGAKEYDKAYKLNQEVLKIAVLINVSLSVVIFFLRRPLIGLFTSNQEIMAMTGGILLIDIFVEIGRAFNHVEENSLRGAGDVVFPMVVAIISCWCNSILFSYILGIKCGLGLYGCWIAFMMDELFRGMIFFLRFKSKKWVEKKV